MNSIKAVVIGSVFIVIVILLMQLAFIFIAVGYNSIAKDFPFLNEITDYFRYIIGIPVFILVMFSGGYITATIAKTKVLLHCFAVGFITAGGTILSALENSEITVTGIFVFTLALIATVAGGLYWQKNNRLEIHQQNL